MNRSVLLKELRASLTHLHRNVLRAASAYKACCVAGMDVSEDVPNAMGRRLLAISDGKLLPELYLRLGHQPRALQHLSALPLARQAKVLGRRMVTVIRDDRAVSVPITEASAAEIVNAIDPRTGGVRPAELQRERLVPQPRKDEHKITITVTYPEWAALAKASRERGAEVGTLIKQAMRAAKLM